MSNISLSSSILPLSCKQLLDWLFARTNYENFKVIPKHRYQENLDLFRNFLDFAGAPDRRLTIVHVAGTKGKGSVCFLLEHLIRSCGYNTGLFTSPHLESILERFMIQGKPCDEESFARAFNRLLVVWIDFCREHDRDPDAQGLTFFEWSVAIAFELFSGQGIDCVLLETGLGGRFDATNVCCPAVSVITSISYDHQDILGQTLKEIALEKAGIVKEGVPFVFCVASPLLYPETDAGKSAVMANGSRPIDASDVEELRQLFLQVAHSRHAPVYEIAEIASGLQSIPMALPGLHERLNATIAAQVAELLQPCLPRLDCSDRSGVYNILSQAAVPGRMERIAADPLIIIDGAHNRMSFRALAATLTQTYPRYRKSLLFGASAGKDIEGMFYELLPCFDKVYFAQTSGSARALSVAELLDRWNEFTCFIQNTQSVVVPQVSGVFDLVSFIDSFREGVSQDELLCVSGSFYLVGEVRRLIVK